MRKRLLVALIFLPLFAWVISLPNPLLFFFMMYIGVIMATIELGGLIQNRGIRFSKSITLVAILLISVQATYPAWFHPFLPSGIKLTFWSIIIFSMLVLSLREVLMGFHENNFANISTNVYSILLVGGIGSYLALLRHLPEGRWWIFILFGFNWFYDSAALFTGKYFGSHQLAKTISPAKTVEGLYGGLAINVIVAVVIYYTLLPAAMNFSLIGFIGLGVLLGLTSQAGDLVESLIKRWSGKKDSSSIIPGHGGLLDKIDNLIFSAPILYLVSQLMEIM